MTRFNSNRRTATVPSALTAVEGQRRGFTLIEMLVALALSAVVISSVYGAIHLQWKVRAAGEARVELARRAQGAVLDLTFDLRNVRRPTAAEGTGNSDAAESGRGAETGTLYSERFPITAPEFTERVLQFDSLDETVRLLEFVGLPHALLMTVERGNPRFPATHSDAAAEPARQICWFRNAGRDIRIPYGIAEPHRYQAEIRGASVDQGLVRVEMPMPPEALERQRDVTAENAAWVVIDDSVAAFRLRYFDGATWQSSWDSSESDQLPLAVEVSYSHRPEVHSGAEVVTAETAHVVIRIPHAGGVR